MHNNINFEPVKSKKYFKQTINIYWRNNNASSIKLELHGLVYWLGRRFISRYLSTSPAIALSIPQNSLSTALASFLSNQHAIFLPSNISTFKQISLEEGESVSSSLEPSSVLFYITSVHWALNLCFLKVKIKVKFVLFFRRDTKSSLLLMVDSSQLKKIWKYNISNLLKDVNFKSRILLSFTNLNF